MKTKYELLNLKRAFLSLSVLFSLASGSKAQSGAALNFDGTNDYVQIPNSSANNFTTTNAFTVEFWAKTNTDVAGGVFVNKGSGGGLEQYAFDFAGTTFRFYVKSSAGTFTFVTLPRTSVITVANGWVHIAGTYDGNAGIMKLYRNGVVIGSSPTPTVPLNSNTNPLCLGAQAQPSLNAYLSGQLDELRLWSVARTQCEIQTYMNCEIPTTATNLTANYHFNQGVASGTNTGISVLNDYSGNAANGTLTNFALTGPTSNWVAPGGVVNGFTTALSNTVGINATNSVVCAGQSVTLNGVGADTYTWTGGVSNGFSFTPSATTNYAVTGTNTLTTCSNTASITITVNPLPIITVSNGTICSGSSFTMSPAGAATYTFSSGSQVVTPSTSTMYSVTGTSSLGCVSALAAFCNVTVNQLPVLVTISSSPLICNGEQAALSVNGAFTYTWNTNATGTNIVVSPSVTTIYTVVATDNNGCVNMTTLTQSVNACTDLLVQNGIKSGITIYPNPGNGIFSVELPTVSNVTIVDVLGKVVYTQTLEEGKHTIDLTNFNTGVYVLKAEKNGEVKTLRLVKE